MSEFEQTIDCPQSCKVGLYHDGELPADETGLLSQHLQACRQCSAELSRLRKLSSMFSDLAHQEMPAESIQRLYRSANRVQSGGIMKLGEVLSAIAAGILIMCLVGLTQQSQAQPASASLTVDEVVNYGLSTADQAGSGDQFASLVVQDLSTGLGK